MINRILILMKLMVSEQILMDRIFVAKSYPVDPVDPVQKWLFYN
jgi:hypothetical protein